ncbi:hypothetical protein I656_00646 [Geobacillus sp. WSUCF1]|nr:hypothetical protein I656_00646 [Geobacillus sp. WSUCF1]
MGKNQCHSAFFLSPLFAVQPTSWPKPAVVRYTKSNTMNKRGEMMQPLKISLETAQKLAKALGVPIEQIMHMPPHILVNKLLELEKKEKENDPS